MKGGRTWQPGLWRPCGGPIWESRESARTCSMWRCGGGEGKKRDETDSGAGQPAGGASTACELGMPPDCGARGHTPIQQTHPYIIMRHATTRGSRGEKRGSCTQCCACGRGDQAMGTNKRPTLQCASPPAHQHAYAFSGSAGTGTVACIHW